MAYDEQLGNRIREALMDLPDVEEKQMFGGLCFMVNGKMCMGVIKEEMMCRIDPAREEEALEHHGCRPMDFARRPMKGYVYVSSEGMRTRNEFEYWIQLCLAFNDAAKKSTKKSKKRTKKS